MKYQTIVENEYSDKIGSVTIDQQSVQLCDHIQIVDGLYHVSALCNDESCVAALDSMGAATKKMYNGTQVAYLNEDMLDRAMPVYQDGMTVDLIARLKKAMHMLNANLKQVAA